MVRIQHAAGMQSKAPPDDVITHFGRNQHAMRDFCGLLKSEARDASGPIMITDIGPGRIRLTNRRSISCEHAELLNKIRESGVELSRVTVTVCDKYIGVLEAVKKTESLDIKVLSSISRYVKTFFPEFHKAEKDGVVTVEIPEKYRERLRYSENDMNSGPIVQSDITFAILQQQIFLTRYGKMNCIRSTKVDGHILTDIFLDVSSRKDLEELGLKKVQGYNKRAPVYEVIAHPEISRQRTFSKG